MIKHSTRLTILLTILLLACAPLSWAQDSTPDAPDTSAMLILDASGSMWQKIGQGDIAQTKIEIARDVVDEMVLNPK